MKIEQPRRGPISLELLFVMPRPKNLIWKKKEMPRVLHTKKPDIENLVKPVMDALSGIVYEDDKQVFKIEARKVIADGKETPRVEVFIVAYPE